MIGTRDIRPSWCSEINFVRFFLITAVVLVHIVNFGNAYPQAKGIILSFLMPTFLLLTGYLVNVEKSRRDFAVYLLRICLPYTIMVAAYALASYYLPVQERLTEITLAAVAERIFVSSIGPYWFLQTIFLCGAVYYVCFHLLRRHLKTVSVLMIFGASLIVIADHSPSLSVKAVPYYFLGVSLRQSGVRLTAFCPKSPLAIVPAALILLHDDMRDWCSVGILAVAYCTISFLSWLEGIVRRCRIFSHLIFIGENTLPIFLFHPLFTMLAKLYLPLFTFDPSGLLHALVTLALATEGSLLLALLLDRLRLSLLFFRPSIIRKR